MEKFHKYLVEAKKIIHTVDHLTYMTLPIVKDKKLLLNIVKGTKTAVANCINSILQYEYLYKRVKLQKSPKKNFRTFAEKCAPKYNITENEIKVIEELFDIVEMHKQSSLEFVRDGKVVILSDNSTPKTVTVEKTKEFIAVSKSILRKAEDKIVRKV